ncbi:hypothetical protein [Arhodomonas sp. AD133]|uniref:hypothetical protein n=1 Tax=Arhodomonas sp. AD133 TaxID=3415009 RepID=UPI003EBD9DC3
MTRTVFLHIGCAKTGSSALQNWLRENARPLRRAGLAYPLGEKARPLWSRLRKVRPEYEITSGNGVRLRNAIAAGRIDEVLHRDLKRNRGDLLYSSETFQSLDLEQLDALRHFTDTNRLQAVIIVFLRDLYDVLYSSYLQVVKRHGFAGSFRDFAFNVEMPQQFRVLRTYEQRFDDIRVLHYDSANSQGVDRVFLQALGIDPEKIPAMAERTVNRSLSIEEAELLRRTNAITKEYFPGESLEFSVGVSDTLIHENPERQTEILYDTAIIEHLENRFREEIQRINVRHFGDQRLQVFVPEGKLLAENVPPLDPAFDSILKHLIHKAGEHARQTPTGPGVAGPTSNRPGEDQVVNHLRDEAVRRESESPQEAFLLMSAARILRPNGQFIQKKASEYARRFNVVDTGKKGS